MEEVIKVIFMVVIGAIFLSIFLIELCWPIILPLLIISMIKKNRSNQQFKNNVIYYKNNKNKYVDVSKAELANLDISDINKLKDYLYGIFSVFEAAYNNLDYNKMSSVSTAKLYNDYHTNILLNLKFMQKKIIDHLKREDVIIYSIVSNGNEKLAYTRIYTMIKVEYASYMIDSTGKVISGSMVPTTESFEVLFIKKNSKVNKCPSCGANVDKEYCDYCKTKVNDNDYKIDSIRKII